MEQAETRAWEWTSLGYTATVWCSPGASPLGNSYAREHGVWTPGNRALLRRRSLKAKEK